MLAVENLSKQYGSLVALGGVSFEVEQGTLHGVIGPNGAGKTTLMSVLSGAHKATSGTVRYNGHDIGRRSVQWRRRHGLSRSFQRTSIFPGLTVRDQLELVARGDRRQVQKIAGVFGLTGFLDRRADSIAYGDQRRVDIALAVIGDARLLLLDEPAAGLTAQETDDVFGHVCDLVRTEGITAVIVEHDVDAIFRSCDRVTVLDLGKVLMTGSPADVRADPRVVAAYLGTAA